MELSLPVIEAYRRNFGKNIAMKVGMPGLLGGISDAASIPSPTPDKPPKLSQFVAFANAFNGIK